MKQAKRIDLRSDPTDESASAGPDAVIRVFADPSDIDAAEWNALLGERPGALPFMRHEYLAALHRSASAEAKTGWAPQFIGVFDQSDRLVAACPMYRKDHSYGEYVFDWAWASAYERHGLAYYPKLLDAVPFTPVPGPRLLAADEAGRRLLLRAIRSYAVQAGLSSAHLLFLDETDQAAARAEGWMMRSTVQFHWGNRQPQPYVDFPDFLASLQREKRKKIQQERRKVTDAGVIFQHACGAAIGADDWDYFYRCYRQTYREHHSTPYLTRDFFSRMASTLPDNWLLFSAWRGSERVAVSLIGVDPVNRVAFGRYWGSTEQISCLHFEACYYQPLAWCIANGYRRFEGGAQGEHKMARGLLPMQTWSAHWLAHPQFARAVADFLEQEGEGLAGYLDELNDRLPFKSRAG